MAKKVNLYTRIEPDVKDTLRHTNASTLSDEEMDAELEKGYENMKAGRTKSVKSAFDDIRKDYGL